MQELKRYLPLLDWGRRYNRENFASDGLAAVIVTVMLIPQSLAYAMLAGLPAEMGLYASMLPLIAYGLFGTSTTLSVGPVAVVSLMTATAVSQVAEAGSVAYIDAAILLALMSGAMLLLFGLLRMGFLASFLSHPVIAGFITASGVIIAVSQLGHVLGIRGRGENLPQLAQQLWEQLPLLHLPTVLVGGCTLLFLFWVRSGLKPLLQKAGMPDYWAGMLTRTGPVFAVIGTSVAAWGFDLQAQGVALVGHVPAGLPDLDLPILSHPAWRELAVSALLISIIGFVESVSVGHTLAARRRQRIVPDQELIGLGASNIAAAVSGGYPVTGGFARSIVNFDAGAATPAAGMLTALGIGLTALFFTPYLAYLPKATLAATIIVAVLSLVDFSILRRTWDYGVSDFAAVAITLFVTLAVGVETGVACGVLASLALHLYKTSRPHMAVVGEVPGTEHYRNVDRHEVITRGDILSLRIDESLYFANASFVESRIYALLDPRPEVRHVILMCTAVNEIDLSALEALESINRQLAERDIVLHLSEVKGPVMDVLRHTHFLHDLTGKVFLSQHHAVQHVMAEEDAARGDRPHDWVI
ncbi:sulfate permease [Haliea sp.]|uniref:SulP family inorganic anion transporter n=1 Tax=Haliea TaxID=475794 RepID=UPI000C5ED8E3|nr:sulfate permease [Haliea sp.]HCD53807.1 sodium-independent anion transporter [Halieaceae bacterium]MAD65369.1 sodium-independent anion transporter [Haliea sp.]MAY91840.1 sodium-independent anion transporter [Haliea sp.]MBK42232.1 sodium-independent anion transporter [Haliea sp.]MBP69315.1 sodium-independent anion transporter [Haliea sp.]